MAKTTKTLVITAKMLEEREACAGQVARFREVFGESATFKTKRAAKAAAARVENKFNWGWAAKNLLSPEGWAEYEKVTGPAWAEYRKVKGAAWAEYEKAWGAAWAEYEKVIGAAWAEYEKVIGAAWAEYAKVRGAAFVEGAWRELAK